MPTPRKRPTRDALLAAIERHAGNLSAVARELGAARKNLYIWIDQLGLRREAGLTVTLHASGNAGIDGVTLRAREVPSFSDMSSTQDSETVTLQLPAALKAWLEDEALRLKRERGWQRPSMSAVVRALIEQAQSRGQEQ